MIKNHTTRKGMDQNMATLTILSTRTLVRFVYKSIASVLTWMDATSSLSRLVPRKLFFLLIILLDRISSFNFLCDVSFLADDFIKHSYMVWELRNFSMYFLVKHICSGHKIILNYVGRKCYFVFGYFERICCTSLSVLVFSNK